MLDETKAVTQELGQEELREEVTDLKEQLETAGEITTQLWDKIDALKEEIEETTINYARLNNTNTSSVY